MEDLAAQGAAGNPNDKDDVLTARLTNLRDPWRLQYYDERIDTHYAETLRPLARSLLDPLAVIDAPPHTFEELVDGVDPAKGPQDPDTVRGVLRLPGLDNYLSRDKDGAYFFSHPFIARLPRTTTKSAVRPAPTNTTATESRGARAKTGKGRMKSYEATRICQIPYQKPAR